MPETLRRLLREQATNNADSSLEELQFACQSDRTLEKVAGVPEDTTSAVATPAPELPTDVVVHGLNLDTTTKPVIEPIPPQHDLATNYTNTPPKFAPGPELMISTSVEIPLFLVG